MFDTPTARYLVATSTRPSLQVRLNFVVILSPIPYYKPWSVLNGQEVMMQIGQLCRTTGMTKDTIRFYEKIGLLPPVKRKPNGYKDYPESIIEQIKLLKHAKELGFTLNEIKEQEIDDKIFKLQAFKQEIKLMLAGHCIYKEQLIQASK